MIEYKVECIFFYPNVNRYLMKQKNIHCYQWITENIRVTCQILKVVWFYLYSELTLTSLVSLVNINKWVVLMELKKNKLPILLTHWLKSNTSISTFIWITQVPQQTSFCSSRQWLNMATSIQLVLLHMLPGYKNKSSYFLQSFIQ